MRSLSCQAFQRELGFGISSTNAPLPTQTLLGGISRHWSPKSIVDSKERAHRNVSSSIGAIVGIQRQMYRRSKVLLQLETQASFSPFFPTRQKICNCQGGRRHPPGGTKAFSRGDEEAMILQRKRGKEGYSRQSEFRVSQSESCLR
jgi:hypothetical protein